MKTLPDNLHTKLCSYDLRNFKCISVNDTKLIEFQMYQSLEIY